MALKAFLFYKFQMNPSGKNLKTSLYVWGNHHISDKNGFQDILHQLVNKHTDTLYPPNFHTDPVLNTNAIEKLKLNLRPWPSVLVIIFGDSNLMNLGSLVSILKYYQTIYSKFSYEPNYKSVTCGVIPPRIVSTQRDLCIKQFNFNLRKMQQAYGGSFISLADQFKFEDYADHHSLNYHGNLKLAKLITETLAVLEK